MYAFTWGALLDKNNNIWIPISNTKSLIKINEYGKVQYIGELMLDMTSDENCILKVLETDNNIIFFARETFEAWIVDKSTLQMSYMLYCDKPQTRIADIVQVGNMAVILPFSKETSICLYDLNEKKIEEIAWKNKPDVTAMLFVRAAIKSMYVYTAIRNLDNVYICKIDLIHKVASFFKIDVRMINALNVYDGYLWLFVLNKNNETVLWKYSEKSGEIIDEYILHNIEPISELGDLKYFKIEIYENKVFFIPSFATHIYVYDLSIKEGAYLNYPQQLEVARINDRLSFLEVQRKDSELYLFPCGFSKIIKLNLKDGKIEALDLTIDENISKRILSYSLKDNKMLKENYPATLKDYIRVL